MKFLNIFKRKNIGNFTYKKETKEYEAVINNIVFKANNVDKSIDLYAIDLAAEYENNLSRIADYMLADEAFDLETGFYQNITKEKLLSSLNMPLIRLYGNEQAMLNYCEHTLDDTHIIGFEIKGLYENFSYLSIDG